jgi:hypothetical protein
MISKGILAKQNYMRERNGALRSNVLTSGSPVANHKSCIRTRRALLPGNIIFMLLVLISVRG